MFSVSELNEAYRSKATQLGLEIDCLADGAFNSQIAIIAEAPGEREKALKVPLVGGSGQLLWKHLEKHKLTRRDVYITNVVKKQLTSTETNDKIKLPKNELEHWEHLLRWELAHLPNVKFVLLLGNLAINALLRIDGITRWRGSVIDFMLQSHNATQPRTYSAVCTYNPAHVVREPKNEITFAMDVAKLPRVAAGKYAKYEIEGHILTEHKRVVEVLKELDNEALPISLDIEIGGGETACLGLANNGHVGFCIPFRQIEGDNYFSVEEEMDIRQRVQLLFSSSKVRGPSSAISEHRFIAQNANFDMYWMWYKDSLRVHRSWFDTMLAHHCLYPTLPHDLGYLCTQYTTHPYYKDERTEWRDKGDINLYWQYNIKDACITWEVAHKLLRELKEQNLDKFFFEHIMRLQPHLVRMTVGGIKADVEAKEKLGEELSKQLTNLLNDFHDKVGSAVGDTTFRPNPLSPKDRAELFFQRLKLVGRGTSTDETNRKRMLDHPRTNGEAKGVIRTFNDYIEKQKFFSTYVNSKLDDDGRIRCEWKQTGVRKAPGRLSSAQTMWGSGMNMQNQPPNAKFMFIADPDYVLCYFDLTQAEAQYVAWDAGIEEWKQQYTKARLEKGGYDAHRALASQLFKVPYDEVPIFDHDASGKPTIRYKAKRGRHGLNYRMDYPRLSETADIPIDEARDLYFLYHRNTPELRKWWASLEQEVRTSKTLFNAYGRRLLFLERLNTDEAMESIVAFKPQSTIGDKVSRVIYMSHEDERWPDRHARIVANVHDALIALAHKDHAKTVLRVMQEHAEEPINIKGEQLIISAELGMSQPGEDGIHRWSTIKKIKEL